ELWLSLFRDPSYYRPEPDPNDPTGASRTPPLVSEAIRQFSNTPAGQEFTRSWKSSDHGGPISEPNNQHAALIRLWLANGLAAYPNQQDALSGQAKPLRHPPSQWANLPAQAVDDMVIRVAELKAFLAQHRIPLPACILSDDDAPLLELLYRNGQGEVEASEADGKRGWDHACRIFELERERREVELLGYDSQAEREIFQRELGRIDAELTRLESGSMEAESTQAAHASINHDSDPIGARNENKLDLAFWPGQRKTDPREFILAAFHAFQREREDRPTKQQLWDFMLNNRFP
ncbi:MAG: hypothetical protein H7842_14715, partial [Gammaproteobacteria bacterium SHHR-1]